MTDPDILRKIDEAEPLREDELSFDGEEDIFRCLATIKQAAERQERERHERERAENS